MSEHNLYDYKSKKIDVENKQKKKNTYKRTTLNVAQDDSKEQVTKKHENPIYGYPNRSTVKQKRFTKRRVIILLIGVVLGFGSLFIATDSLGQTTLYPMAFALLIVLSYLVHKDGEVTVFGLIGYILGSYGIVLLLIFLSAIVMLFFFLAEALGL